MWRQDETRDDVRRSVHAGPDLHIESRAHSSPDPEDTGVRHLHRLWASSAAKGHEGASLLARRVLLPDRSDLKAPLLHQDVWKKRSHSEVDNSATRTLALGGRHRIDTMGHRSIPQEGRCSIEVSLSEPARDILESGNLHARRRIVFGRNRWTLSLLTRRRRSSTLRKGDPCRSGESGRS